MGTTHFRLSADTGAREVARRLARKVRDQGEGYLKLGEEVKGLEYMKDGTVEVRLRRDSVRVDTVILATQASAAEKLLGMLNEEGLRDVQEALRDVQYRVGCTSASVLRGEVQADANIGINRRHT